MDAWSTVGGQRAMDAICRIARELEEANKLKKQEIELLKKIHGIEDEEGEKS